ncbi:MAG TPA: hypothetical protein VF815_37980 [Myxococcaceae bacterium]|jgi:hypothetical protein
MRLSPPSSDLLTPTAPSLGELPPSPELSRLNAQRLSENARVLTVLGSACALGAVVGGIGARAAGRVRLRAFFQAATSVHLFVLGTVMAGAGAVKAQKLPRLGPSTTVRRGRVLQRMLGVGLGLDVVSMAIGTALLWGKRGPAAWREGAGTSFLLHGLALLVFDTGVFRRNALHQQQVESLDTRSSLALGNLEHTALI